MILDNKNEGVKSLGFESAPQMTIKNSNLSKIFKLLSTSTYKNSEESIIREICSNAVDAHVAVGKPDEPIYLKYDGNISISIIDNGIGMSDEFVNTEYMSLGESTKENDSSQIGAFGIGRASIFSYTNYFYLTSRWNGKKRYYLISENDGGLPDVMPLSEEDTSEVNGVEVKFELKNTNDFYKFKTAAINQLKYFRNVIIEGFGIENDFKMYQGNHFIYRPDRQNVTGKLEVVWHNVCYPIDFSYLGIPELKLNCALYFPQNTPFQPEAARENLRNIESNKKLILEKIELVREELTEMWKKDQIVDSYLDWSKMETKEVVLAEGCKLNVGGIINENYIWRPLLKTKMDNVRWGNAATVFDKLIYVRSNSRSYNNSWRNIGIKENMYNTEKPVSNAKLARNNWTALIQKRGLGQIQYSLASFYKGADYKWDNVINDYVVSGIDPSIDWEKEIAYIQQEIWNDIKSKTIDIHSIINDRQISERRKILDEDVRGKFSYDPNNWQVIKLSTINKYKYVVYTNDEIEYNTLRSLSIVGYSNKRMASGKRVRKSVDNFYLVIFCHKKYNKRLSHHHTYEQFLKSNLIKSLYIKHLHYLQRQRINIATYAIERFGSVHPMYKRKFSKFLDYRPTQSYLNLNNKLNDELKNLYFVDLTDHYNKIDEEYDKVQEFASVGDKEGLKYKLLYTAVKNKLNKK